MNENVHILRTVKTENPFAQYIDEPITEIDNTRGHVITEVPINSRKVQEVIDNSKE